MGVGYVEERGDSPACGEGIPGKPCLWGSGRGKDTALLGRELRRTWPSAGGGSEGTSLGEGGPGYVTRA